MSQEAVQQFLAALMGGAPGEGLPVACKETIILEKFDGEATAGKAPVETLRFEGGMLVEHLIHGQPVSVDADRSQGHADDATDARPAGPADHRSGH